MPGEEIDMKKQQQASAMSVFPLLCFWRSTTPLREGLRKFAQWYKNFYKV